MLIEIKYAGICHSDIHTVRGDWGPITYPLVVGHEIAGVVAEVGSEVTMHQVGDRVGVGCMVNSCRECENCLAGEEQYCLKGNTGTYAASTATAPITQGGYSTHIVVAEDFVLRVPESIPLDAAAPLLCAGITTYSPLRHWNAGPGKKVAVVGLGGLGHMAVKIAHAMGAEVTVLSQSLSKKDDGLRLGADHYYATSDADTFSELREHLRPHHQHGQRADRPRRLPLACCASTAPWSTSAPRPSRCRVARLLACSATAARSRARAIGGIRETQEMLDFCAEHGIAPEIEVIAGRPDQRGLRARARLRRALPLRHRHRLTRLICGGQLSCSASPTMMPSGPRT